MRKLLGIVVLGLLLSGCGGSTYVSNEVTLWQQYKESKSPFKAYGVVHNWKKRNFNFSRFFVGRTESMDAMLLDFHKSEWCTKGCRVEYIGDEKITEKKQKEIALKYLPPGLVEEMFSEPLTVVKKPKNENESEKIVSASGTAFFIDKEGHLITNHHVIKGCKDKSQISFKNKNIKAKLIAKDEFLDLALLKADVNNINFITISDTPPNKLNRIIVAGYPFGIELSNDLKFNSGIITSLKGLGDDSTRIQIDAAINPGNSGGPIVYEENGQLVAVAVAGLSKDKTEAVNFGIKASSVKNFLQSNQIDLTLIKKKFNFSNDDLAELLESSTVYTFCE